MHDLECLIKAYKSMDTGPLRNEVGRLIRKASKLVTGVSTSVKYTQYELDCMNNGQKLGAIKSVRRRLDKSLLEAKHYVEEYMGKLNSF